MLFMLEEKVLDGMARLACNTNTLEITILQSLKTNNLFYVANVKIEMENDDENMGFIFNRS